MTQGDHTNDASLLTNGISAADRSDLDKVPSKSLVNSPVMEALSSFLSEYPLVPQAQLTEPQVIAYDDVVSGDMTFEKLQKIQRELPEPHNTASCSTRNSNYAKHTCVRDCLCERQDVLYPSGINPQNGDL